MFRTFRSGNSEALRLPKDVAFGADVELVLVRSGHVLTVYPAQALVHRATLVTPNADDFSGVPGLQSLAW